MEKEHNRPDPRTSDRKRRRKEVRNRRDRGRWDMVREEPSKGRGLRLSLHL